MRESPRHDGCPATGTGYSGEGPQSETVSGERRAGIRRGPRPLRPSDDVAPAGSCYSEGIS